jgi:hypothetical protein
LACVNVEPESRAEFTQLHVGAHFLAALFLLAFAVISHDFTFLLLTVFGAAFAAFLVGLEGATSLPATHLPRSVHFAG